MKLIQLNVWWGGKLTSNVERFLRDQQADILCLQEATSTGKGATGMFMSVEEMQEAASFPYLSFGPMVTIRFMHRSATMGNAILSKLPITNTELFYTYLEHNKDFDWEKHDYNVRNLLHCEIDCNGRTVHVLTHHGHHIPEHKNGDSETLRQMKEIAEYIEKLEGPIILTGDFNLAPDSKSLSVINKTLTNLSIKHGLKTTRTDLTHKKEVCDYIFANNLVKVKHFEASDILVSDHKALILEFGI